MILPLDSCVVNSPDKISLEEVAPGADYDLSTLGETIPDERRCWWCGMPDGPDERIVERYFRPLKCRKPGPGGPRVHRLLRPLCTDCVEALELDWCVECRDWHPKRLIGDDELCPPCRIVKALGMVEEMAEVERSYAVSKDAEGWINFHGETDSDCASVLIALGRETEEKRELSTAVVPGPSPRFSEQVFLGVAAIWRTFPQARERFPVDGESSPQGDILSVGGGA